MHHGIGHITGYHPSPGHQAWDLPLLPPTLTPDIRHGDLLPPAIDICWSSLETCSNLFTWGPTPHWYWHLVVATETPTVGKRAVHILLECCLIYVFLWEIKLEKAAAFLPPVNEVAGRSCFYCTCWPILANIFRRIGFGFCRSYALQYVIRMHTTLTFEAIFQLMFNAIAHVNHLIQYYRRPLRKSCSTICRLRYSIYLSYINFFFVFKTFVFFRFRIKWQKFA